MSTLEALTAPYNVADVLGELSRKGHLRFKRSYNVYHAHLDFEAIGETKEEFGARVIGGGGILGAVASE